MPAIEIISRQDLSLVNTLKRGGQSIVFVANWHTRLGIKPVAVKVYDKITTPSVPYANELTILSQLSHPSLPKLIAYFEDDKTYGLILELIMGQTLSELIVSYNKFGKAFSEGAAQYIAYQLLKVLDHLQSYLPYSIVHNDISADNIFLSYDGRVILIDFGASLMEEVKKPFIHPFGKRRYLAPELFDGDAPSIWSDLYSFGSVMFEVLLLRSFTLESLEKDFALLRMRVCGNTNNLFSVIKACLAPTQALRPKNAHIICDLLKFNDEALEKSAKDELIRAVHEIKNM